MSEEIKSCPFCGGPADAGWFAITHNIGCGECQYSLDACKSDIGLSDEDEFTPEVEAAIARFNINRWNTRADLARAQIAAPNRIWPDAADGSPSLPMVPELWAAGCDLDTARFVARQLAKDGYALVKAEQTRAAAFAEVIGHLTYNKPDQIGNVRAQGYYRGWMDALAAVRKMAREKEE